MNRLVVLAGLTLLIHTSVVNARVSETEFQQMQQMLEQALARIKELERQHTSGALVHEDRIGAQQGESKSAATDEIDTTERIAANTARLDKLSWAERVRLNGDFLYRYQLDEGKDLFDVGDSAEPNTSRNRQRVRAHLAVIANLPKNIEVGLGFATGGDSPVSTVQTLGGSGSSKSIQLDLAYFDWSFNNHFNVAMGKFRNSFYRPGGNGLFWDSDWRPEGFDLRYGDDLFYVNTLGTWFEGDSNKDASKFIYGLQAGFTPKLGHIKFNLGAGYWDIKTEGENCFDSPSKSGGGGTGRGCFGNTAIDAQGGLVAGGTPAIYFMDITPLELYASVDFDTQLPWGVFVDFAKNTSARAVPGGPSQGKKLDTAYAIGTSLGRGKQTGEWQFKLSYQDVEADSVLGLLTDSNFGGGGTDSKGFKLSGKYMMTDQASVGFTYYHTERQDSNGVENGSPAISNPFDRNTLQINVLFKAK